ncbi:MAG TPA: GAF and ANTAR domain-containing protein [Propionibacteriaceae bacterium]|nr:GAF and ANTAR domain-containing protein [Propionibacteriaceae bacterium]
MSRETRLSHLFIQLADTLVDDFDVVDFLHGLAEGCVEVLEVDAAGLMLADQRGGLRLVASAPEEPMNTLELFELQSDQGPCLDSFRSGSQVVNVSIPDARDRWPRFTAAALDLGMMTTHALPLRLRGEVIGAMNLASTEVRPLSRQDLIVGQALADVATIGLLQERAIQEGSLLAEQLQSALTSRVLVEQAKGVLAERLGVDVNEGFARLRRYSRRSGHPLRQVAQAIVDGRLDTALLTV